MDSIEGLTLELDLDCGKCIRVQVAGYHLKLSSKFNFGAGGWVFNLGTFKINSKNYPEWKDIKKIKYQFGECSVLKDQAPKETARTITFKVRHDLN